jgi:hypothetical protein
MPNTAHPKMKLFGLWEVELIRPAGHQTNTNLWQPQAINAFPA